MFTLLGEVNLWTFDDNVIIKETDFGAFRYYDRCSESLQEDSKRSYCQKRGMMYIPSNRKGNKLKGSIKYLEEQLRDNSAMYYEWYDQCIVQAMLSNGLLIQIQVNNTTGDIEKIMFDKYFIGKVCDHITDVSITKNHLICTYNDQQVTVAHFPKPKQHIFDKFSKLEPKVSTTDLFGLNGRRLDKKIQVNKSEDLILIWWKSATNEVYPWSPTVKEHDRANMFLYHLSGIKLQLICYVRTEFDPLCITFDVCHDNIIHSVEQKVSRKGEVTLEWRTYEVSQRDKLQRIGIISIFLPTHTSCIRFSPNQELLLLCCIDGSVILYDQTKAATSTIKTAFIPTLASWHSHGMIFAIGNDRGQFQHFDISLSNIKSQILNEDATPASILDLSSYFRNQPALLQMEWNKQYYSKSHINYGDTLFLLLFERGPMGVIKVIEGDNLSGDVLVKRYLSLSQIEQATSLLLAMNWDTHPCICMHSLNQILNYLFKLPLTTKHENLIQNALGSFYIPVRPISQAIEVEYADEVRDLTRRFFHHLLRYRLFEKAFRLAIDLNDHDLFMDIHFYAIVVNDTEMANAAKEKAEQILSRSNSCTSSHSRCSRTSCSICSDSISDQDDEFCSEQSVNSTKEDENHYKRIRKHVYSRRNSSSQIPPLPVLHPNCNGQNLLPTSFTIDTSFDKADCNLMSTSFNIPNSTHAATSFDHSSHISISNTFFASTSFSKPICKTHSTVSMSTSTISMTSNSQIAANTSDDLMTTSFGNLSVNDNVLSNQSSRNFTETRINKSLHNHIPYSFNDTYAETAIKSSGEINGFVTSTPFNNFVYESVAANTNDKLTSLDRVGANSIMSTSFGTVIPNMLSAHSKSINSMTSLNSRENIYMSSLENSHLCEAAANVTPERITDSPINNFIFCNTTKNVKSTSFKCPKTHVAIGSKESNTKSTNTKDHTNSFQQSMLSKGEVEFDVPPPPSLTIKSTTRILQRQNSISNILQNEKEPVDFLPSKNFALKYDFNYIPQHSSCDHIDMHYRNPNSMKYNSIGALHHVCSCNLQNKEIDGKQLKLGPSTNHINVNVIKDTKISSNIPPLPVLNGSHIAKPSHPCPTFVDIATALTEKPKVKFSDTVTHILVPGSTQVHKQKRPATNQLNITDPKRELAESLPLCLGNEDYLKDFQPLPKDESTERTKKLLRSDENAKIKVVHFGLL